MADALVQALMAREKDLYQDDPFLQGSGQIMGQRTMNPLDPWGSLAAALGQGLAGGLMQGYGKDRVYDQLAQDRRTLYDDVITGRLPAEKTVWGREYQPFLDAYAQDQLDARASGEKEMQRLYLQAQLAAPTFKTVDEGGKKVTYISNPSDRLAQALGGGEGRQPANEMEALGFKKIAESSPRDKNPFGTVPTSIKEQLYQAPSTLQAFDDSEKAIRKYSNETLKPFVLAKIWGTTDAYALQSKIDFLAANLKKAFEGKQSSTYDAKTYERLINGNWSTVTGEAVANLLGQAKNMLADKAAIDWDTASQMQQNPKAVRDRIESFRRQPTIAMPQASENVSVITPQGLPELPAGYMWRRKAR